MTTEIEEELKLIYLAENIIKKMKETNMIDSQDIPILLAYIELQDKSIGELCGFSSR